MSYFFHPNAEKEHFESVAFYETKRAGLGSSYLLEFESVMAVVCEHPYRYPIEEQPEIRRVRLKQFPIQHSIQRNWQYGTGVGEL